jgi:secondary thiamine-phosphate synthase enzyme
MSEVEGSKFLVESQKIDFISKSDSAVKPNRYRPRFFMRLTVKTHSQTEMVDVTTLVQQQVTESAIDTGLCLVFVPHTTAAVTINESADPAVARDILMVLNKIVPWKEAYRHMEGNSPAHLKTSIIGSSQTIAIDNGRLVLGTWQGIFFCEFDGPRTRRLDIRLLRA